MTEKKHDDNIKTVTDDTTSTVEEKHDNNTKKVNVNKTSTVGDNWSYNSSGNKDSECLNWKTFPELSGSGQFYINETDNMTDTPVSDLRKILIVGIGQIGKSTIRALQDNDTIHQNVDLYGYDNDNIDLGGIAHNKITFVEEADLDHIDDFDVVIYSINTPETQEEFLDIVDHDYGTNTFIIVQTTVWPGTMEKFKDQIEATGAIIGEDMFLIYAPARHDSSQWRNIGDQPRIIGGIDPRSLLSGISLFRLMGAETYFTDFVTAELSKLYENFMRTAMIELTSEFNRIAAQYDTNMVRIAAMASTKENIPFIYPGLVGGSCLPKNAEMLDFNDISHPLSRKITDNTNQRIEQAIEIVPKDSRVLVIGMSYKYDSNRKTGSRGQQIADRIIDKTGNTTLMYDIEQPYPPEYDEPFDVIYVLHISDYYADIIAENLSENGVLVDFTGSYRTVVDSNQTYEFI